MKFGEGLVTAITEGGRDYEVTVEFDRFGVKKMFAAFAKLQKLMSRDSDKNRKLHIKDGILFMIVV